MHAEYDPLADFTFAERHAHAHPRLDPCLLRGETVGEGSRQGERQEDVGKDHFIGRRLTRVLFAWAGGGQWFEAA